MKLHPILLTLSTLVVALASAVLLVTAQSGVIGMQILAVAHFSDS
ncbi:hypothetical protein ACSFA8_15600 [Variovorax sp. RT4R15]